MKLFCDLTNQRFALGMRIAADARPIFTQNDSVTIKAYLLAQNQNGGGRFPFMYDVNSGSSDVAAAATLCNPGRLSLNSHQPGHSQQREERILRRAAPEYRRDRHLPGWPRRTVRLPLHRNHRCLRRPRYQLSRCCARPLRRHLRRDRELSPRRIIRLTTVTGYTGGGPTKLDGISTVGRALGTVFWVKINGAESHWELVEGSTASDPDSGIILTTDGGQLVRTIGL
jgi:hypothetical protein